MSECGRLCHGNGGTSRATAALDYYLQCLEAAGFAIEDVTARTIEASVEDWFEFLSAYHEAVVGWVGGSVKVDGQAPAPDAVRDRLALIRHAMDTLFGGRPAFRCCWTYINGARAGGR